MKRFTLISAAIAATLTASAQWNVDNNPVVLSGTETGQTQPKVALTKDGKMYLAWRTAEKSGKAVCYSFPHLQLFDKDGNALFGVNGLAVSKHRSPSWNDDYSLVATSDGCAIISNADSRSEEAEDLDNYNNFTPVWYKIDQKQNFVWGLDGLALTDRIRSPFTDTYLVGDDIWIQDKTPSDDDSSDDDGSDDGILFGDISFDDVSSDAIPSDNIDYFNRVTADGTLVFENPLPISGQIIPSIGGDFLSIGSGSNGTEVQRYNREGKNVWSETSTIASTKSSSYDPHPYRINPDGRGGAYATWTREVGMFGYTICTQHVSADGDPTFGLDAMDALADENIIINYAEQAVDTKNNTVLVTFPTENGDGSFSLRIQKFNEEGDRLFGDNGKTLEYKDDDYAGWGYNNYGVEPVGDGEWLICYSDKQAWALEHLYVARINKDGEFVWKQQIMEEGNITSVNFVKGEDCSYVVYQAEDDVNGTMLKGARIFDNGAFDKGTGISIVNENLSKATSTTIHSIDGKLVQTVKGEKYDSANLAPGMYIITTKDAQGKTKSMKITK